MIIIKESIENKSTPRIGCILGVNNFNCVKEKYRNKK